MAVRPIGSYPAQLAQGDVWSVAVLVTDTDPLAAPCWPIDATTVLTVTPPSGPPTTPDMTHVATGLYEANITLTLAGRYVAVVDVAGYGTASFAVVAAPVVTTFPAADDLTTYLGGDGSHSFTDEELDDVIDAEAAAQRRVCRIPATYDPDLRQALLRRCAVNLAKRGLPLMVLQGDGEIGTASANVPGKDSEVRRLEGPWRRLSFGNRPRRQGWWG